MKISYRGFVWALAFGVICPAAWVAILSTAGVLFNIF